MFFLDVCYDNPCEPGNCTHNNTNSHTCDCPPAYFFNETTMTCEPCK